MGKSKSFPIRYWSSVGKPAWQMPIPLRWDGNCLSWPYGNDRTPNASSADLRSQIAKSAGKEVPNSHMASFGPDDVVICTDGFFWINPEWEVLPLPSEFLGRIHR